MDLDPQMYGGILSSNRGRDEAFQSARLTSRCLPPRAMFSLKEPRDVSLYSLLQRCSQCYLSWVKVGLKCVYTAISTPNTG